MLYTHKMLKKSLAIVFVFAALSMIGYGEARRDRGGGGGGFVGTNGTHFVLNGRPFYVNGFNGYWLMYMATDPLTRNKVNDTFVQASKLGINIARTWAFSDGHRYRALQTSPGAYNEDVFKGLDFVVSEASKHNVYLIMSLVNNWDDYGGKSQYVQWARDRGHNLSTRDDFFTSNITKDYYKNHVEAVLTRNNTITGVAYKDDPNIFAWELINEPRCQSDLSGNSIQDWVTEMSAHVKSIDDNHLLEIGLEGFYLKEKRKNNPGGYEVGTDFISNNNISHVDFATIHLYPNQWLNGSNASTVAAFVVKWIEDHIDDSKTMILGKPLLVTEFGKSSTSSNYTVRRRNKYLDQIFNRVYGCARRGGPCGGALFWQVMAHGMENWSDGYDVVFGQSPSTDEVILHHSHQIDRLNNQK